MNFHMNKFLGGMAAGAAVLALSACLLPVGDGEGLTISGDPIPLTPPDTNLTFVFDHVFKTRCAGCHGSEPAGDAMNLASSVASARDALFPNGEPRLTAQLPDVQPRWRVLPDEPDSSYLLQKLIMDDPKAGVRMPQGGMLNDELIEIVRTWIRNGASLE